MGAYDSVGFAQGNLDITGWQDEYTGAILPGMSAAQLPRGGFGFRPILRPGMPGGGALQLAHPAQPPQQFAPPQPPPQQFAPNPYGAGQPLPITGQPAGMMVYPTNNPSRPGIMRREVLPLGSVVIAPSSTVVVSTKPQKAFRVERLVILTFAVAPGVGKDSVMLNDFVVGTSPQFVASGDAPTGAFSPDAVDTTLRGDTATAGVDINLRFTNLATGESVRLAGIIVGACIDQ